MPAELDEILRRSMQLEIEREALRKEKDAVSKDRLSALERELADLRVRGDSLQAQWQAESRRSRTSRDLREEIEQTKIAIDHAERDYDLNRAAELRYGKLAGLEEKFRTQEDLLFTETESILLAEGRSV